MDVFHGGNIMKTGEARGIYSSVLKSYNEQKFKLSKQREELKERMESTPDGKTRYADEAATLDCPFLLYSLPPKTASRSLQSPRCWFH